MTEIAGGPRKQIVEVPVIETARLLIRGHRPEDLPSCAAMWANEDVTRYIGGVPLSREEVWTRVLRYVGHWSWMGFGHWAIEDKSNGRFVGEVGFADFKRSIEPSIEGTPEIGWALDPSVHGQGYATEAVRAVVSWSDLQCAWPRTVCLIHPDNLASLRVAEKCGYRESQRTVYKNHPTILFAR